AEADAPHEPLGDGEGESGRQEERLHAHVEESLPFRSNGSKRLLRAYSSATVCKASSFDVADLQVDEAHAPRLGDVSQNEPERHATALDDRALEGDPQPRGHLPG